MSDSTDDMPLYLPDFDEVDKKIRETYATKLRTAKDPEVPSQYGVSNTVGNTMGVKSVERVVIEPDERTLIRVDFLDKEGDPQIAWFDTHMQLVYIG